MDLGLSGDPQRSGAGRMCGTTPSDASSNRISGRFFSISGFLISRELSVAGMPISSAVREHIAPNLDENSQEIAALLDWLGGEGRTSPIMKPDIA
ncbi:MAG: hypothetical protein ACI4QC_00680, partial [Thermoguttaceae bacterium]